MTTKPTFATISKVKAEIFEDEFSIYLLLFPENLRSEITAVKMTNKMTEVHRRPTFSSNLRWVVLSQEALCSEHVCLLSLQGRQRRRGRNLQNVQSTEDHRGSLA